MRALRIAAVLITIILVVGACDEEEEGPPSRPPPNPRSPWKVAYDYFSGEVGNSPGFTDMWFSDPEHGWACHGTRVFKYENGAWRLAADLDAVFPYYEFSLESICAPSPNEVWVGATFKTSSENLVFHYDGAKWEVVHPGFSIWTTHDIFFVSPEEGWFGCWSYGPFYLLHYDHGSWTSDHEGIAFVSLSFTSADNGWGCGFDEASDWFVYRWDGSSWTRVPVPGGPVEHFKAIDFTAADDGWLVGDRGNTAALLHFDGTGWTEVDNPLGGGGDCAFSTPSYGWIADTAYLDNKSCFWDGRTFTSYPWPWDDQGWTSLFECGVDDVWACTTERDGHAYILHFTGFE